MIRGRRLPRILSKAFSLVASVLLLLFATACDPVVWVFSASTIAPKTLHARLSASTPPLVVDLREYRHYAKGHIIGAKSAEFADVSGIGRALSSGRDVVLVCEHGRMAAMGVTQLRGVGVRNVTVLEGGMTAWSRMGLPQEHDRGERLRPARHAPLRLSRMDELFALLAGLVIKPTYMLISLGLFAWLRREASSEMRLLRAGLMAFFIGESACLAGFYLSNERGLMQPLELLHGFGMGVGLGLGAWGLTLLVGRRMLRAFEVTEPCPLLKFCGKCSRSNLKHCGLQRMVDAGVLLLLPLTMLPWTRELSTRDDYAVIGGATVSYRWAAINLATEFRFYPVIALALFLVSVAQRRSLTKQPEKGLAMACLGFGFLGFCLLRLFLVTSFEPSPYWGDFWEELLELQSILALLAFLLLFRNQLGLRRYFA